MKGRATPKLYEIKWKPIFHFAIFSALSWNFCIDLLLNEIILSWEFKSVNHFYTLSSVGAMGRILVGHLCPGKI
jgi:hypothetical protein